MIFTSHATQPPSQTYITARQPSMYFGYMVVRIFTTVEEVKAKLVVMSTNNVLIVQSM